VTPQAPPIRPSAWMARLWGDDDPIFADEAQINAVLRAVMIHYNTRLRDIDRSLERLEAKRIVDYRPLFLDVRSWVRGFWQAMELAPETWSALVEEERTNIIMAPSSRSSISATLSLSKSLTTSTPGSMRTPP
jgi:uncharacterized protein